MTKANDLSEIDAIKAVIAEGGAMDYIDVVDAVEKRYRIKTSSLKVEEVHREMANSRADSKESPKPRVTFAMTSELPTARRSESKTVETPESDEPNVAPKDEMALALQFVRSVGGLKKAKRALEDLESVLRE